MSKRNDFPELKFKADVEVKENFIVDKEDLVEFEPHNSMNKIMCKNPHIRTLSVSGVVGTQNHAIYLGEENNPVEWKLVKKSDAIYLIGIKE